jgi:hypothetical protein
MGIIGARSDLASNTPSNWTVTVNNGVTLTAVNSQTNAVFTGTPAEFAALFNQSVETDTEAMVRTVSEARLVELNTLGSPVPKGIFLKDPTTGLVYGQSDGAGSFQSLGGGGGVGGWGSDRTTGIFELDETSGEYLVTVETIDGIPWTIGRDLQAREILRQWTAGGLSRTVSYASGGGVATGNFVINGGEIWVPLSTQMPAIKTALAGLGVGMLGAPRFHVADLNLSIEWNRVDACFRGVGKAPITFTTFPDTGSYTSLSESSNIVSAVFPGWLSGPHGHWEFRLDARKTGGVNPWTLRVYAGTEVIASANSIPLGQLAYRLKGQIRNRGGLALNYYAGGMLDDASGAAAWSDTTLNTGNDVTWGVRMLNVTATGDTLGVKAASLIYSHR